MTPAAIPNIITTLRLFLAIPLIWLLWQQRYQEALWVMIIAGLSDGVDGYIARRYNWLSRLGAILDPLSDKVLLVSCFLTLGLLGDLPMWLVMIVIVRDIVIVAGGAAFHLLFGRFDMEPTLISKTNTLFQITLLVAVVMAGADFSMPSYLIESLILVVLFTTLYSGVNYVWVWGRRAMERRA